jgi:hypothetical protein
MSEAAGTLADPMPKKMPELVSPEWLAVVRKALTDEVCGVALRYAWGRVEMMKRAEVVVQEGEAAALANDAVADTLTRVRVWDPDRVKLTTHLCGVIRSRTNARMARVRKIRHESIHEGAEDEGGEAEIAASLAVADDADRADAALADLDLATKVVEHLRRAAAGDDEVIALLDSYAAGVTVRPDVLARLGWDLPRFVNVKRRLSSLVRSLPTELHEAMALESEE